MSTERRMWRSSEPVMAVAYQLVACCDEGVEAMVLADGDGEPLVTTGNGTACRQVSEQLVKVGRKIRAFQGTLFGPERHWDVQLTRIEIEGIDLILCAVGGDSELRSRQILRSEKSLRRILGN